MARGIMLYLKEGIAEDDQILAVWHAASQGGRPQELFRRLLMLGIRAAHERGEMTRAAMEVIDPSIVMPLGGRAPLRAPGVPQGWQAGDPPFAQPVKKPRGRSMPRVQSPVVPPVAPQPVKEPRMEAATVVDEVVEETGGLGRLMG